jgi:hypothetical protein
MTGEPKASHSPSGASKTRYLACIVEYFICFTLVKIIISVQCVNDANVQIPIQKI